MRSYRVTLTGISGAEYVYSIPLPENVPPIEAKARALALHGDDLLNPDSGVDEVVRPGARIERAPRCGAWWWARFRPVRCVLDRAHAYNPGGEWHVSPKGDGGHQLAP